MISVLLITASAGHGGGPQHLLDLAKSLRGHFEINIACPKQEPFYSRFREAIDGQLLEIPERKFGLLDAAKLLIFAKKRKISLIHSHGKGAGVYGRALALLGRIPVVHTLHGVHIKQYNFAMRYAYLIYERLTKGINSQTILVSQSEYNEAKKLGIINRQSSCIINNGVAFQEHDYRRITETRKRIRNELNLHEADFIVVTLSRFDYQKNMLEALKISCELPHIKFLMLGAGEDYYKIKREIGRKFHQNVLLPGFVNNPQDYLAASDVFLSTSLWEGMPLATLEAMSNSLPVVASDVIGTRDVVLHDNTGYLYTLGNIKEASNYIKSIAKNPKLGKKIGQRGRDYQREHFTTSQMVTKTREVYEVVLKNG